MAFKDFLKEQSEQFKERTQKRKETSKLENLKKEIFLSKTINFHNLHNKAITAVAPIRGLINREAKTISFLPNILVKKGIILQDKQNTKYNIFNKVPEKTFYEIKENGIDGQLKIVTFNYENIK